MEIKGLETSQLGQSVITHSINNNSLGYMQVVRLLSEADESDQVEQTQIAITYTPNSISGVPEVVFIKNERGVGVFACSPHGAYEGYTFSFEEFLEYWKETPIRTGQAVMRAYKLLMTNAAGRKPDRYGSFQNLALAIGWVFPEES